MEKNFPLHIDHTRVPPIPYLDNLKMRFLRFWTYVKTLGSVGIKWMTFAHGKDHNWGNRAEGRLVWIDLCSPTNWILLKCVNVLEGDVLWFHGERGQGSFGFGTLPDLTLGVSSFGCSWFVSFIINMYGTFLSSVSCSSELLSCGGGGV